MIIVSHYADDGTLESITVTEALPVELIAAELFERADRRWLRVWHVEDGPDGVRGKFSINADNGVWTYELVRRSLWMDGVYEARLISGTVLRHDAHTTAAQ